MTIDGFKFEIFSDVIFLYDGYYICYTINCSLFHLETILENEHHFLCLDYEGAKILNVEKLTKHNTCIIIFSPNLLMQINKLLNVNCKIDSKFIDIIVKYNLFLDYALHNQLCKKIKKLKHKGIFYKCNCTNENYNNLFLKIKLPFQFKYFKLCKRTVELSIIKNCNILFYDLLEFKNIFAAFYYYILEWPLLILCENEKQRNEIELIVKKYIMHFQSLKFIKKAHSNAHKKLNFSKCKNAFRAVNRELNEEFDFQSDEEEKVQVERSIRDLQLIDTGLTEDKNLKYIEDGVNDLLNKIQIKTFKEMKGKDVSFSCIISLLKINNTNSNKYKMVNKLIKKATHCSIYCYYPEGPLDHKILKQILVSVNMLCKISTDRSIYYDNKRAVVYNRCTQNIYYKILYIISQLKYRDILNLDNLKSKIRFLCKKVISIGDK